MSTEHDSACPKARGLPFRCDCGAPRRQRAKASEASEAVIRADERAKHPSIFDVVQSTCGHRWVGSADEGVACPVCEDAGVMTRRALADLRAKVMGLRDRGLGTVLRSDVLALFPEEKP